MLHEQEKAGKIVAELSMYFMAMGATRINSSILLEEKYQYLIKI